MRISDWRSDVCSSYLEILYLARIAGVNIPTNKRVIIALTYIHGIGRTKAIQIADKLGIDHSRRVQDLSDPEVLQNREAIDAEPNVDGHLTRHTAMNSPPSKDYDGARKDAMTGKR